MSVGGTAWGCTNRQSGQFKRENCKTSLENLKSLKVHKTLEFSKIILKFLNVEISKSDLEGNIFEIFGADSDDCLYI